MTTPIPDPLDLLREQHRAALDRKAELDIEARNLAARARQVAVELNTVTAQVSTYGALVAALTKPKTDAGEVKR